MKTQIWTDPIVEEVRATREALARENGYDLNRLAAKKPAKKRGDPAAVALWSEIRK